MLSVKKLLNKILLAIKSLSTVEEITLTRDTGQSYVGATNFARLHMYFVGNIGVFIVNLSFATSLPSNSTWVKIGTFDTTKVTLMVDTSTILAGQSAQAHILFSVEQNGNIRVWNGCGTASGGGFFRSQMLLVRSNGI